MASFSSQPPPLFSVAPGPLSSCSASAVPMSAVFGFLPAFVSLGLVLSYSDATTYVVNHHVNYFLVLLQHC